MRQETEGHIHRAEFFEQIADWDTATLDRNAGLLDGTRPVAHWDPSAYTTRAGSFSAVFRHHMHVEVFRDER